MSNADRSGLVVLTNVTLMWPSLQKTNKMSGKYQVDLSHLTPDHEKLLKTIGITAIDSPDKGRFITCKSKHPIKALDKDGNPVMASVGNGSKANLLVGSYQWTAPTGGKKGTSASIAKLVVTDLVEYIPMVEGEDKLYDVV